MGNWRTVHITGTCAASEVAALRAAVRSDQRNDWANHGPLCFGASLCGLSFWPAETFDATGNLWERDYTPEDVAEHLRELLAVAPSLTMTVHCGGDYEDTVCIATVTCAGGVVAVGPPAVADVGSLTPEEIERNMIMALLSR